MTSFAAFQLQDSGLYSSSTKASGKFAVVSVSKEFVCKKYTDLYINIEMEEQVVLSDKLNVNDFDLTTAVKGWTKIHNS